MAMKCVTVTHLLEVEECSSARVLCLAQEPAVEHRLVQRGVQVALRLPEALRQLKVQSVTFII